MGLATLTLSGLVRAYGRQTVLDGLSLQAEPGMITAIVAPHGGGKSTLIRILAGFERPQAGQIELDGHNIVRVPAHRRRFGVVQQPDLLFPHLTIAENVAFPLRVRGTAPTGHAKLVATTLEQLQLSHAADLRPRDVSPADAQRALLARASVFAPRVLLLDEPFTEQDHAGRMAMIDTLRRMHALLGCTTLVATSHGAEALAFADRLAILRHGVLDQYGPPAELFDRPRNAYVAGLLGETNCLPATVEKVDDDIAILRLECGPVVEALRGRGLHPGDACLLNVRPDRIALAAVSAANMGEGAIDAAVLETQFFGDSYRLRLLIGSGAEIIVRRPAASSLRNLEAGDAAAIAWQSHHALAFRTEERGAADMREAGVPAAVNDLRFAGNES
jgi:putative spermidine/putrescine transport system ATP-binding protein